MEEIDPMAFNNGEEDSGLSMAHTFVNDGSNSKLYLPSKKTWKFIGLTTVFFFFFFKFKLNAFHVILHVLMLSIMGSLPIQG